MTSADTSLLYVLPTGDAAEEQDPERHFAVEAALPGAPLVISFGFAQWDRPPAFDFVRRLRKLEGLWGRRFHRIHLRDPQLCWYLKGVPGLGTDLPGTIAAIARIIDALQPSRVVTLGQSMGGYGAILFGQQLRADRVVAFGALSTMEPAVADQRGDTRWITVMRALADEGIEGATTDLVRMLVEHPGKTEFRLHYGQRPDAAEHGPENLDLYHARRFAALPLCKMTLYQEASHTIVEHLRLAHELDATLLQELFDVDPGTVHRRSQPLLGDNWLQWIAENRLRGSDVTSMLAAMQDAGIASITARSAVATVVRDPVFRAACALLATLKA